jgi:hypothetical protein
MFTVLVSYMPIFVSAILLVLGEGIGSIVTHTSFSLNPYESAYGLLFHSDAKLFFFLIFLGLYMIQKVVMTLSYFSRPELSANNFVKTALA